MLILFTNQPLLSSHKLKVRLCRIMCMSSKTNSFEAVDLSGINDRTNDESECDITEKLVYNSKIKHFCGFGKRILESTFADKNYMKYKSDGAPLLALKYFSHKLDLPHTASNNLNNNELLPLVQPVETHADNCGSSPSLGNDKVLDEQDKHFSSEGVNKEDKNKQPTEKWMEEYNKYTEVCLKEFKDEKEDKSEDFIRKLNSISGTADTNIPPSSVPCGGCGAFLHCQVSAIPGYLPKEIFSSLSESQLQAVVCQRCHFLREYNTALSVSVDPAVYPQLLSQIKGQKALVILIVDITDFPCSIWPGILDIIGPKRPLVVVGNKIDLLQGFQDQKWLEKAKEALKKQLPPKANVLHTALVSAKTGFGIEDLITYLYGTWEYRGDVYLVGSTNVGKSTLFNALLQSDYCKTKAVDLVQRATTAPWPGTTLNLLKFPIMRPDGWRIAMRSHRLKEERVKLTAGHDNLPQMTSSISRTFAHGLIDRSKDEYWDDPFAMPKLSTLRRLKPSGSGLDPNDPVFAQSKWLYDTPGVITSDQIIDLLTTAELMQTIAQKPLIPRTFAIRPGQSLLIAALGRLDYLQGEGSANIKMTVLAAATLPVTICAVADTESVYHHYLGSEVLAVPHGSRARLSKWPGLKAAEPFTLRGLGWRESCADVVLSSSGWIAVTADQDLLCQLQAWTPQARGIHVRIPPVLPHAVAAKGQRMYKSQAYAPFTSTRRK